MKGLELCRSYYEEVGAPALRERFPELMPRAAAGLCGQGSDCLGLDDEYSRDHDFGPGFCLWLSDADFAEYGEALQQACVRRFWSPERQVFVCNLPWEREEGETRYHDRDLATAVLFDMCPGGKTARSVELLAEEPAEMGFSYPANAVWRLWALIKANRIDVVLNDLRTRWAGMESVSLNNTLQEGWHAKPDNREQWSHCPIAPLIVLQQGIAGIRPLEPGYGRFEIAPQPGDLTDAAFTVQTVKGPIDFAVSGKRGNRRLSFTVPAGTTAELVLPAGEKVPFPPVASEGGDGLQNGLQDGVGRGLSDLLHDGQSGACRYRIDGGRKVELRLRHL